jgi:hypothetical protein
VAEVSLANWPQNSARDWRNGKASAETMTRNARPVNEMVVDLANWSALRSTDGEKGGPRMSFSAGGSPLPSQVSSAANGREPSSSGVRTGSTGGSLHPEFAGWEMGYSPAHLNCAPTGIASTRRQPQSSSVPTSKPPKSADPDPA